MPVVLRLGKGLRLPSIQQELWLGCGPQDVLVRWMHKKISWFISISLFLKTVLGPPEGRFNKTDDKLKIHSERASPPLGGRSLDYFYNYCSLGLDVLFDGELHTVIKFVVHSNFPSHDSFNRYNKCNWTIETEQGHNVNSSHLWSPEVRAALGIDDAAKPVVYNRPAEDKKAEDAQPGHLTTLFYGRHGIIVEVMKSDLIESVQMYA